MGSILLSAALSGLLYLVSKSERPGWTSEANYYGIALFVAMPILHGMAVGLLAQCWSPQTWSVAARSAWLSVGLLALGFLVMAWEGVVCLLLAAPLVVPLVFLGTWLGWRARQGGSAAQISLPALGILALSTQGGSILPAPEAEGEVRTSWWIAAPPERVWPYVLRIDALPEPDWWLFRLGVTHPTRTWTKRDGTRMCELSTGPMPEIVTVPEEGRRLAFRVISTPPSIRETNPFGEVHAPHLTSTFRCDEGEFRLTPERGGTRIDSRSTYGLKMGPAWYWMLWADAIVAHTHERVVGEIRKRAITNPVKVDLDKS